MKRELISIIVPVYNVEKYLRQCIESILKQTYPKFELILVDDGSTDSSGKICDEYALKDGRIKVVHKQNGGISSARNKGLEVCHGNYICFVDSDDYIRNEMLEKMYIVLKERDADLLICGLDIIYDTDYKGNKDNEFVSMIQDEVLDADKAIEKLFMSYGWQYVVAWNKLYKKEVFSKLRYPENCLHEDEIIIHRLFDQCKNIVTISDKLYYYRQRNNSIMSPENKSKRADDFLGALSDRTKYLYCTGRKKRAKELATKYWVRLHWNYQEMIDNDGEKKYSLKIQKSCQDILFILLKEVECSWKEKVSMIIFAISPQLYIKLWG